MMDVTRRESGTRIRKRDVVFLTAKLGSSRETAKSENHSSSNISAIRKQSETTFFRKYHKLSQFKRKHGSFRSVVERKHKNERTCNETARNVSQRRCALCFLLDVLYSLRPRPMYQSANLFPSRAPIPPNDPPPRDHRSIEAQKNSRENENNGPLSRVSPPLNRETSPLCSPRVNTAGEAFAPLTRAYALTEFRLFAFTLHRPTTTHTISIIFE